MKYKMKKRVGNDKRGKAVFDLEENIWDLLTSTKTRLNSQATGTAMRRESSGGATRPTIAITGYELCRGAM